MQIVSTPHSRESKGHYSPAVIHGDLVYVSGQLPINYAVGETLPAGGIEEQTRQALKNLDDILKQCGSNKQQVLKTTVYIPDITYWPVVNEIYAEFFGDHKPSRTIVPTNTLHFDAMIEIEAIAYIL
ncbi:RidA family protein [Pelosinus sp. UFO1]|uniref:RidA family protein n=1 Tax=Pelosinus sp. UFO1 TaxID=484770 RepID=UPI0004D151CE|nr:RidA family protein [Pelosinus sp. UFO1]AIF51677.1 endoribonuclease L-PSP [Pelosinus sp. UFO1]